MGDTSKVRFAMTIAFALFVIFGLVAAGILYRTIKQAIPAVQALRYWSAEARRPVKMRFTIAGICRAELPALPGRLRSADPARKRIASAKRPKSRRPLTGVAA